VVGNSAGAALGLAAAQWLRDSGYQQPGGLVLISPGGDFSIRRPEQIELAARDPINDIPGARETGRLYAGDLDVAHPYHCTRSRQGDACHSHDERGVGRLDASSMGRSITIAMAPTRRGTVRSDARRRKGGSERRSYHGRIAIKAPIC
jgi:hypothetical protein